MLTLFSVPKPFTDAADTMQRNALGSWKQLGDQVEVMLIGDERGVAQAAAEYGFRHLEEVERNHVGTPRVDSAFALARRHAQHPLLCYLNADIIVLGGLLETLERLRLRFSEFLLAGQRWDLAVEAQLNFAPGWQADMHRAVQERGALHPPAGSDYFAFPRGLLAEMPPFAIGRSGWDNWVIYAARRQHVPVVDATEAITVVHQEHDYAHLEGGQAHYRLPESQENVKLAGGRQAIFTLRDATWRMQNGAVRRVSLPGGSLGRAVEAGLITLAPPGLAQRLLRVVLHPLEFLRGRVARRRSGQLESANDAKAGS